MRFYRALFVVATAVLLISACSGKSTPTSHPASEEDWQYCMDIANVAGVAEPHNPADPQVYTYNTPSIQPSSAFKLVVTDRSFKLVVSQGVKVCGIKLTVGMSPKDATFRYLDGLSSSQLSYNTKAGERLLFVGVLGTESS